MLRFSSVIAVLLALVAGCDAEQAGFEAAPRAAPATQSTTGEPADKQPDASDRLHGVWVADNVPSKIGPVRIRLTFREDGPVKIMAWSELPFVGQVRDKTAPYEATDSTIHSEALEGGTTVDYWFNPDGRLIIEYRDGKTVAFSRA
jgi:hypothetical protein